MQFSCLAYFSGICRAKFVSADERILLRNAGVEPWDGVIRRVRVDNDPELIGQWKTIAELDSPNYRSE